MGIMRNSGEVSMLQGGAPLRFITDSLPCGSLSTRALHTLTTQASKQAPTKGSETISPSGCWPRARPWCWSWHSGGGGQRDPIYVAGCPVLDPLQKSSTRGRRVGEGGGCSHEGSTHPMTSRQPGVGLGRQAHGAERQRDDRVLPRTSENYPSEAV